MSLAPSTGRVGKAGQPLRRTITVQETIVEVSRNDSPPVNA
jgi:hypothetical protein